MNFGPVEILVLAFPENRFSGAILPELTRVVENGTITIIDGLFVQKASDGSTSLLELDELGTDSEVSKLRALLDRVEGLISDEDVSDLTASLEPNSAAAILVFEHTWAKPLRDVIVDAGGVMLDSVRIPGAAVDELRAALAQMV